MDDESLPSKIEHVSFQKTQVVISSSDENSIKEEIEYTSDQEYSEHSENEKTKEITMSNPKYEEIEELAIECNNWADSHSEEEVQIEAKNKSAVPFSQIFSRAVLKTIPKNNPY